MKKKITVAVAVILALAAIITGIYFIFFRGSDGGEPKTELVVARDDLVESVGYIEALVKNPDRYKNLQVRVCGWNTLWNNMDRKEQDAYILRAENISRSFKINDNTTVDALKDINLEVIGLSHWFGSGSNWGKPLELLLVPTMS